MPSPGWALLAFAILIALLGLICWPGIGLLYRLRSRHAPEQVRIEDALKHLFDREYLHTLGTVESLAGALDLPTPRAAELVSRLIASGLADRGEQGLRLTSLGRRRALRVIRIHRLWEAYLANQTGFDEADWHIEADRREHRTTPNELADLVRRTGDPRYDPHGDPIPTPEGDLPLKRGRALCDLPPGSRGLILHVEDEPEAIYVQLRAARIRPQQHVAVRELREGQLWLEIDGEARELPIVAAANVWVQPTTSGAAPREDLERLAALDPGQAGMVVGLAADCQGLPRRRLLDLGLVPGTRVEAELRSPAGDPTAYRIRGAVIALRRTQAEQVRIRRLPAAGEAP